MSLITKYATKVGINDFQEISMLENFFQNPEIIEDLQKAEEYRKKRYMWLIGSMLSIFVGLIYFGSLGIFQVEIGHTHTYRPTTASDGFFWAILGIFFTSSIIIWAFRSKIEGAIKQKILTKLSKVIYSKLEYDEGRKYAFGDLPELTSLGFIRGYDTIDNIEDSLAFSIQEDGKHLIVQGYELQTSKETRDSKGRRHKTTTNHCYLLKAQIPSARIPLENDLFIRTDQSESIWGLIIYMFLGALILGFICSFIGNALAVIGLFLGGILGYFIRNYFINKNRIKLENIAFEKLFDVKCEDPIGSRMIITPAFMDRLVKFAEKSKWKYELLYRKNCFYIKWNIHGSYLEVNTWKKITENLSTFVDWYMQMKEIISFIFDMRMIYFSKTDANYIGSEITPKYESMNEGININNAFGNSRLPGILSTVALFK